MVFRPGRETRVFLYDRRGHDISRFMRKTHMAQRPPTGAACCFCSRPGHSATTRTFPVRSARMPCRHAGRPAIAASRLSLLESVSGTACSIRNQGPTSGAPSTPMSSRRVLTGPSAPPCRRGQPSELWQDSTSALRSPLTSPKRSCEVVRDECWIVVQYDVPAYDTRHWLPSAQNTSVRPSPSMSANAMFESGVPAPLIVCHMLVPPQDTRQALPSTQNTSSRWSPLKSPKATLLAKLLAVLR